ncbi:MAG: glutamine cyclotransferase [Acidimicrobiales bacterium]|jgi:glutaminyl-peptide cyclotransferase
MSALPSPLTSTLVPALATAAVALLLSACGQLTAAELAQAEPTAVTPRATAPDATIPADPDAATTSETPGLDRPEVKIVSAVPHDPDRRTAGLEFLDGVLLESTRIPGDRAAVDPATGAIISAVLIPDGEGLGLTVWQNLVFQITSASLAVLADSVTLERLDTIPTTSEFMAICAFGEELAVTDGGNTLRFLDPMSFTEVRSVQLADPSLGLIEPECVDGIVWATTTETNRLVAVDPATGAVLQTVDVSSVVPADAPVDSPVGGIAYRAETGTFFLTGGGWTRIVEVTLPPITE